MTVCGKFAFATAFDALRRLLHRKKSKSKSIFGADGLRIC